MAREYDDFGWVEKALYDDMSYGLPYEFQNDRMAQVLYDESLFNYDLSSSDRAAIRDAFEDYMRDTYGVDFDHIFDWESYRAAYDAA